MVIFSWGSRKFAFRVKPHFPKSLSREFLLVDLVNNLDQLAEAKNEVLGRVKERAVALDGLVYAGRRGTMAVCARANSSTSFSMRQS
jgi:hypothetical protein